MNEVLEFLNDCGTFFIATVEGDQPRVRPFGFAMEHEGKICFATSNQKPVFQQLSANPKVEISASKNGQWLRLCGNAVSCTTLESKTKALEIMPNLKNMYSAEDTIFEIFSLENAVASIFSFQGDNKTINL